MLKKFYSRLRSHYSEESQNELLVSQPAPKDRATERLGKIPEDKLYGQIAREDFEKILEVYDLRQQSTSARNTDKPVECKIIGNSYAKLLFSKPGFHNMDSTSYLIDDLRISDTQRVSFLGGYTRYDSVREDNIASLMKTQERLTLRKMAQQAQQHMENKEPKEAFKVIEQMRNIDDKNIDFLFTRGRYNYGIAETEKAVDDFRRALQGRPDDTLLKQWLSDALCSLSKKEYQKRDFRKAYSICCEALDHNPHNTAADLHLGMCKGKIQEQIPFAPKPPKARK